MSNWSIASIHPLRPQAQVGDTDQVVLARVSIACPPFLIAGIGVWHDRKTGKVSLHFPNDGRWRRVLVRERADYDAIVEVVRSKFSALEAHPDVSPLATAQQRPAARDTKGLFSDGESRNARITGAPLQP